MNKEVEMSKVALALESTTVLPPDLSQKYNIPFAPAIIIWEGEEIRDGIDIQPEEFFTRLAASPEHPTTSHATPIMFKEIYDELLAQDHDILTLTISSKLSGMYSSAVKAKEMLPGANIEVIDTRIGAVALIWPVKKVLEAIEAGASLAECKSLAEKLIKNTGIIVVPETLEYLHRGGRIGGASKFIGTALNFKPILEIVDGAFEGRERVRTHSKALNRMIELTIEKIGDRSPVYLGVMHANAPEVAAGLLAQTEALIESKGSVITSVSPGVGVHLGPGTVGLAYMAGID
jgi:DegV family protein with EDD domain